MELCHVAAMCVLLLKKLSQCVEKQWTKGQEGSKVGSSQVCGLSVTMALKPHGGRQVPDADDNHAHCKEMPV